MIDKTSTIEYVENLYGLSANYLKKRNNNKLREMMAELERIEDNYMIVEDLSEIQKYDVLLSKIVQEMEAIIDE